MVSLVSACGAEPMGTLLHAPEENLRSARPFVSGEAAAALEMAVRMGSGFQEECAALHHVSPG